MSFTARTVGHLVELPLTSGRFHSIDPEEVVEVGAHHEHAGVTIVRLRDTRFTLYVKAEYDAVRAVLAAAFAGRAC